LQTACGIDLSDVANFANASEKTYGAYRDRTGDLRLAKPALSQLS
jgi:hypothetical protein